VTAATQQRLVTSVYLSDLFSTALKRVCLALHWTRVTYIVVYSSTDYPVKVTK